MTPAEREVLERRISEACALGDFAAAATSAIEGYGGEILGYLCAATHREQDAAEMFSDFCFDLWRGLPSFRRESSFRTWAYRVAYHAMILGSRRAGRRRARTVALEDAPEIDALAEQVRTRTLPHLRTEMKQELAKLREQLDEHERTLLILRVDRRLEWEEIARIVDPDVSTDADVLRRSATLRKRFERLKTRLKRMSAGMLPDE